MVRVITLKQRWEFLMAQPPGVEGGDGRAINLKQRRGPVRAAPGLDRKPHRLLQAIRRGTPPGSTSKTNLDRLLFGRRAVPVRLLGILRTVGHLGAAGTRNVVQFI